ncbi:uncharacterized protein LOC123922905 [Trifolium pratense]|uniref:uncharacterized protein LOC123922905 n=1 Tax=Trifolium pratense TaxID=57577 RepID=UPI001E692905|nr:uncharacterized protein LOC123922905 [Trifolium pratense]
MISKVLANRLKICLDKCVSQEQSAFVEGRSILDNALIAIEVIHALKRKTTGRRGELALNIDINKAYDKSLTDYTGSWVATRRPFSPYLFILVAEGLTSLIHQDKCSRSKSAYEHSSNLVELYHNLSL